jgi:hypothetical protein
MQTLQTITQALQTGTDLQTRSCRHCRLLYIVSGVKMEWRPQTLVLSARKSGSILCNSACIPP